MVVGCNRAQTELLTRHLAADVSLAELWHHPSQALARQLITEQQHTHILTFQAQWSVAAYQEWLAAQHLVVLEESAATFPALLREISDCPLGLWVKGELSVLNPSLPIAVVGTRHMTPYGEQAARWLVSQIAHRGGVIVSGGMYGIDWTAHQTALAAGTATIAVVGFGLSEWYPRTLERQVSESLNRGLTLVSEYPPHWSAQTWTFPRRNRLIAGMTLGVLVVEAAARSGSLITARWAAEYGREVWTVPGPLTSQQSQGTTALANEGAVLVNSAADIMATLPPGLTSSTASPAAGLMPAASYTDRAEQIVWAVGAQPRTLSGLQAIVGGEVAVIQAELRQLELAGALIKRGSYWQIGYNHPMCHNL